MAVLSVTKGQVLNYAYNGSKTTVTLPIGTYKLEVWGAQGGYRSDSAKGGKGGYSCGTVKLNEPTNVYIYPGGAGGTSTTATSTVITGGFNGGGYRYGFPGGGGASDVRIGADSLYARVIVAGGGGSCGASGKTGGYGGGLKGMAATESYGTVGYGGTQTGHTTTVSMPSSQPTTNVANQSNAYGGFGFGGFGTFASNGYGGAGGGGWYGGCAGYPDSSSDDDRGGGGGSGYVYTVESYKDYPSGCLLNGSYMLTDTTLKAGNESFTDPNGSTVTGHSGNGQVRITVLDVYSGLSVRSSDKQQFMGAQMSNGKVRLYWNPSVINRGTDSDSISYSVTVSNGESFNVTESTPALEYPLENDLAVASKALELSTANVMQCYATYSGQSSLTVHTVAQTPRSSVEFNSVVTVSGGDLAITALTVSPQTVSADTSSSDTKVSITLKRNYTVSVKTT